MYYAKKDMQYVIKVDGFSFVLFVYAYKWDGIIIFMFIIVFNI